MWLCCYKQSWSERKQLLCSCVWVRSVFKVLWDDICLMLIRTDNQNWMKLILFFLDVTSCSSPSRPFSHSVDPFSVFSDTFLEMFQVAGSCIPTWVIIASICILAPYYCTASLKKATCSVKDSRADCSHLSLNLVPQDLPSNITSLDMSHNRMTAADPDLFKKYSGLLHLNISYNSIKNLDEGLCRNLPHLQTLNMMHNEVHLLKQKDLSQCTNLKYLNMASNRLKLQEEPFSSLQVRKKMVNGELKFKVTSVDTEA